MRDLLKRPDVSPVLDAVHTFVGAGATAAQIQNQLPSELFDSYTDEELLAAYKGRYGIGEDESDDGGEGSDDLDIWRYPEFKMIRETPAHIDAAIRSMRRAHGDVMAVQSKTILKGGLHLAVMANVIGSNPVRDVAPIRSKTGPKGATALTADDLRELLVKLRASEACQRHDLIDPITLFIATGGRISELLGCLWTDYNETAATLTITGKLVRAAGKGLLRIDDAKTPAGLRTLPLPSFAVTVLSARRSLPYLGGQQMIFPSAAGTWRDPDNFRARWREVREALGVPDATSHSFRKTVATLIDDEGLSARIGADHLGHSRISMTQDKYMARGRVPTAVADLLDRTINDE
jgi:integrase